MREETLRMERVTYREQGVTQLENFSMSIWAGEIMGLMPEPSWNLRSHQTSQTESAASLRVRLLP